MCWQPEGSVLCLHRDFLICSQPLFFHSFMFPIMQRDERVLVVWSDNLDTIIPLCRELKKRLIRHTVTSLSAGPSTSATPALTPAVNQESGIELNEMIQHERTSTEATEPPNVEPNLGGSWWGWIIGPRARPAPAPQDVEKGRASLRPVRYLGPFYSGLALALSTCLVSLPTKSCSMLTGDHQTSLLVVSVSCSENLTCQAPVLGSRS